MESTRAQILIPSPESIAQAAQHLLQGELVAMPTETVYGLAGLALRPESLAKIFSAKERPTFDPLIAHVALAPAGMPIDNYLADQGLLDLRALSSPARNSLRELARRFWPGPLTLVLPKQASVPDLATAGLGSVAIRMPAHPVAQALLKAVGQPLAAPSANRFGRISPTSACAVASELGDRISLILDGGPCQVGIESTIFMLDPVSGGGQLLRPGAISPEEIEVAVGMAITRATSTSAPSPTETAQLAPGRLESHYAPRKDLILLPRAWGELLARERAELHTILGYRTPGALLISEKSRKHALAQGARFAPGLVLSPKANAAEAAREFFASLRALDDSDAPVLVTEPIPVGPARKEPLWLAIEDRLRRASRIKIRALALALALGSSVLGLVGCGGLYTDKTYAAYFAGGNSTSPSPSSTRQQTFGLERLYLQTRTDAFSSGPGTNFADVTNGLFGASTTQYNLLGNMNAFSYSNPVTSPPNYAEIIAAFAVNSLAGLNGSTSLSIRGEASGGTQTSGGCSSFASIPTAGNGFMAKLWIPSQNTFSSSQYSNGVSGFTNFDFTVTGVDLAQSVYADTSASPVAYFFVVSLRSQSPAVATYCSSISLRSIEMTALP